MDNQEPIGFEGVLIPDQIKLLFGFSVFDELEANGTAQANMSGTPVTLTKNEDGTYKIFVPNLN